MTLPEAFLSRPAPTPRQIWCACRRPTHRERPPPISRARSGGRPWTYGRLVSIARLGLPGLLDVLEAMAAWRAGKHAAAAQSRTATSEFDRGVAIASQASRVRSRGIDRRLARARLPTIANLRALEVVARSSRRTLPLAILRRGRSRIVIPAVMMPMAESALLFAGRALRKEGDRQRLASRQASALLPPALPDWIARSPCRPGMA